MAKLLSRRDLLIASASLAGCASLPVPAWFPAREWELPSGPGTPAARALDSILRSGDTTGMMVVQHGHGIYSYGNTAEISYLASARKSLVSMLYGPSIERGVIDLDQTLDAIGFDDDGGLLARERRATIRDLLAARSGIYHRAANLGDASDRAPPRGSVDPGSYFLYNNWDFNALGAIFEQLTHRTLYRAFEDDIARRIGMEDWNLDSQAIRNDTGASRHPAHHFVLSTRDMARLGLLMLREGRWGETQVIGRNWVRQTTALVTSAAEVARTSPFYDGLGYGYLWWVFDAAGAWPSAFKGGYTASGAFGQFITVLPGLDLVIAHKTKAPSKLNVPPERYFGAILPAAIALAGGQRP